MNAWVQKDDASYNNAETVLQPQIIALVAESTDIFDTNTIPRESFDLELDMNDDCEEGLDMESLRLLVKSQLKPQKQIPLPRQSKTIEINFTQRGNLPTTVARESEDVKWNARIREMNKLERRGVLVGGNAEEFKIKGDGFFGVREYASAVGAYSEALRIDKSTVS